MPAVAAFLTTKNVKNIVLVTKNVQISFKDVTVQMEPVQCSMNVPADAIGKNVILMCADAFLTEIHALSCS
jgi:hypothetical protein